MARQAVKIHQHAGFEQIFRAHGQRTTSGITPGEEARDAMGLRPDGTPWTIAVECPDRDRRAPHSILTLQDAAVATSGDSPELMLNAPGVSGTVVEMNDE